MKRHIHALQLFTVLPDRTILTDQDVRAMIPKWEDGSNGHDVFTPGCILDSFKRLDPGTTIPICRGPRQDEKIGELHYDPETDKFSGWIEAGFEFSRFSDIGFSVIGADIRDA